MTLICEIYASSNLWNGLQLSAQSVACDHEDNLAHNKVIDLLQLTQYIMVYDIQAMTDLLLANILLGLKPKCF